MAAVQPAVLQVHGQGPFAITYANPADDHHGTPVQRHGVCVVPIKEKWQFALLLLCDDQPDTLGLNSSFSLVSECAELNDDCFGVTRRA